MDLIEKLEVLVMRQMGEGRTITLSQDEQDKARHELSKLVLMAAGRAAINGDAAAARLLFDLKVLNLR